MRRQHSYIGLEKARFNPWPVAITFMLAISYLLTPPKPRECILRCELGNLRLLGDRS